MGPFLAWHENTQLHIPHWKYIDLYELSIVFSKPQTKVILKYAVSDKL